MRLSRSWMVREQGLQQSKNEADVVASLTTVSSVKHPRARMGGCCGYREDAEVKSILPK